MAKIETGKAEIIWSYISSFINSTINLFALPLILRMLIPIDIGLWYVFLSIASIANLLDFGFSPTLVRNISYCWCGATELFSEGLPNKSSNNETNYPLLKSLLQASKKIYFIISSIAFLIVLTGGSYYVFGLLDKVTPTYVIAWLIFSVSIFTNIYFVYYNASLRAIGAITTSNKINIMSRLIYLVFLSIGLILGYGIIALSIANLIYSLILGTLSKRALKGVLGVNYELSQPSTNYSIHKVFTTILPNAKKSGLVSIITFIIVRFNTLLAASFLGLEISASYSIAVQILETIGEISKIIFNTFLPKFTSLILENEWGKTRDILSLSMTVQWLFGISAISFVVLFGDSLLEFIGSSVSIPQKSILIIMGITLFLGWNHSNFATYITLSNTVPFLKAGVISAFVMCIASIILLEFSNLGLWALVLPRLFVSVAYDNWKWPSIVCKQLGISIFYLLKNGINQIMEVVINGFKTHVFKR